jgi:flagellar basal body-associated protein FliL
MASNTDPEYTPLSQPKGKKRSHGPLIAVIAFGILVLAGGGVGAYIWYSSSHKAAENAALVSKFPLIFLKLYKSTSQVFLLSDQEIGLLLVFLLWLLVTLYPQAL